MKKYLAVIKVSFMENLVEREVALIWSIQSAIMIVTVVSVWLAGDKISIENYDRADMITYYFLLFILEQFTGWFVFWDIRGDIMRGRISNYLLKPISYVKYLFAQELGYRFVKVIVHTIVSIFVFFFLSGSMRLNIDLVTLVKVIPAVIISILIFYQIQFAMGCMTFFWTESRFIADVEWVISSFFGGRYFPLVLFPMGIYNIVKWNPFRFTISLSAEILLGKVSGVDYVYALCIGTAWAAFFTLLARLVWKSGLKKYSAFGS